MALSVKLGLLAVIKPTSRCTSLTSAGQYKISSIIISTRATKWFSMQIGDPRLRKGRGRCRCVILPFCRQWESFLECHRSSGQLVFLLWWRLQSFRCRKLVHLPFWCTRFCLLPPLLPGRSLLHQSSGGTESEKGSSPVLHWSGTCESLVHHLVLNQPLTHLSSDVIGNGSSNIRESSFANQYSHWTRHRHWVSSKQYN